ncbi:hypothetical protein IEQ34_003362 [Dendrobium chrysotoxum]|uniref:Rab3-GAP regulatory subunit N-terminal domain-containing protein n=1 Tax=Dendrobium chrysotoxum TaxID=161865 RepID=A0AAV7H3J7_DENCH|nr:hypothetical protein IEQ34_003362 [Dendrobium chrysotoxum]
MSRTGQIVQSFELFVQYDFLGDVCKSIVRKDSGSLPHLESEKDDGSLPHLEGEKDDGSLPHLEGEKDDGSLPHLEGEKDDGTLPHRGWWKRICKGFSALLWGQKERHLFILVVVEFLFQKKKQKLSLFVLYEDRNSNALKKCDNTKSNVLKKLKLGHDQFIVDLYRKLMNNLLSDGRLPTTQSQIDRPSLFLSLRFFFFLPALARRSHFTDLCCIACSELEDLGAGEREGWLSDSSLLSALHPHALALAHSSLSLLLLLPLDPSSSRRPTTVRPSLSAEEGRISAIEWLPFADLLALALGTSSGSLLIYSLAGIVHPGRILRLRFREKRGESLLDVTGAATSSEELCVVLSRAVARFDGSDIQSLFRRWLEDEGSRMWNNRLASEDDDDSPYGRIPFQLWNVSKYGSCVDAAIVGIMPPPLLELQSCQRYYCAIAVGEDAVISAFRLSEDRSRSIVGTILSKVVPATFSTLASVSRMIWRSEQTPLKKPQVASQPFAKASPLTCLKDSPRKGEKLAVSPSGTLAAITDSLGRILLLDTQALVVVRLWKGYREASCLFMEAMIDKDKASTSSNYPGLRKNDYYLCLAIHAPRKGIIEIWKMRTGPRLLTVQCPKGSIILQPSTRSVASSSSTYNPLEVFLLNGDSGQLSVLNRSIS